MAQENAPHPPAQPSAADPVDALIDRIADAVVTKMDERRKIDAIAYAVLERLQAPPSRVDAPTESAVCARQGQEGET